MTYAEAIETARNLAALSAIRDYRARRWADLSFAEVQALDRSAAILSAAL